MSYFFTSESVSEGHPDKVCDQISDAVLDDILAHDKTGRVACETFCATGLVLVGGEITTHHYVDIQKVVRDVVKDIGYTKGDYRFDYHSINVMSAINKQSPDIAMGVDKGGAGDQGMMFGYATNETKELMPMALVYAHALVKKLADIRKKNLKLMPWLRPDSKSQVTVEYDDNGKPLRIDAVVVSTQHDGDVTQKRIREEVIGCVINNVIPAELLDRKTKYYVNPTGRFEIGGPHGDSGLTGRKIIVDTYGGAAPHGGGAFSGKDPSKVDRSAAYASRHIAKNIVAAKLADKCLIQVSYAIGVAEPISIYINTEGTGKVDDKVIAKFIHKEIDMTPKGIIERLDLRRPIYRKTSNYGHFGRNDKDFTWEKLDFIELFKKI
ncbi:MAG: methionine adenosyltransferase [Ignavibacteriae bacterium]|nr:MAG: methionine adenosyltransferase [Ignavibacteriota bacterium]